MGTWTISNISCIFGLDRILRRRPAFLPEVVQEEKLVVVGEEEEDMEVELESWGDPTDMAVVGV